MTPKPSPGDRLYSLLPSIHRARDAELGYPLYTVLRVLEDEYDARVEDIARLYDGWFIETCDAALLPRFAELLGVSLDPPGVDAERLRRHIANAIALRRRKGTAAVLDHLALDATGWPARVIEFGPHIMATASARFPETRGRRLVDVADGEQLDRLSGWSPRAALPDVRRVASRRRQGTGNLGAVGVIVWRLIADGLERAPAANVADSTHYTFDPLGRDVQLCVAPSRRTPGSPPASDLDIPAPITRLALERRLEDYYGPGRSVCVYRDGRPVPRAEIVVANLGGWRYRTPPGRVSVDPVLGRIAFSARHGPEAGVWASGSVLTMGAIGGGHYDRPTPTAVADYRVGQHGGHGVHRTVNAALRAWASDGKREAVIEIADDGVYEERITINLAGGRRLRLRAAPGCRPILLPSDRSSSEPDMLHVTGPENPDSTLPEMSFAGVWVAAHPVKLAGRLGRVAFDHCTLVPAAGTRQLEGPHHWRSPSLVVSAMPCTIAIGSCVIGRVRVESPELGSDPVPLTVRDSVLDAADGRGQVIEGTNGDPAWIALTVERTTVLGAADVTQVDLVQDTILMGPLRCERRQLGDVRFSYLTPGSRTPPRTACLSDSRVEPRFDALDFGAPAYARLARDTPAAVTEGAHDGGELGVYHDLREGLKLADLRARLHEFAPAGTDVDIILAT